jgi:hypothetical protein
MNVGAHAEVVLAHQGIAYSRIATMPAPHERNGGRARRYNAQPAHSRILLEQVALAQMSNCWVMARLRTGVKGPQRVGMVDRQPLLQGIHCHPYRIQSIGFVYVLFVVSVDLV